MPKLIVKIYLILLLITPAYSASDSRSSFYDFIKRLYKQETGPINRPLIEISTTYNNYSIFQSPFSEVTSPGLELKYGFNRFHDKSEYEPIFGMGSEFAFIGNNHNNIDIITDPPRNINSWYFGFGFSNGWGWNFKDKKLFLEHSSSLLFADTDFLELGNKFDPMLEEINDELKFAQRYSSAIVYEISNPFYIDLAYQHTIIYPEFGNFKWFGSWMAEIAFQRWIDFFKDSYVEEFGPLTPIFFITYKTAISLMFYELRSRNRNWPFISERPVNIRSFRLNFVFVF